ncbi:hypothetical protein V5799_006483 [Amblyomma americanum]|uniref:Sulfatase N-terminal domain-containing protein n=1 Tax=Amblyomma americanum TaxID=6943 RepID=A0AAQ4DW96_AMBAM
MLDNTVVVFSSDNGGAPWGLHASRSFNWPLRGVKGTLWEGGTRVAAFIWSPRLRRNRTVSHQLMHITDWLPTLYSVAGGNAAKLAKLDGHNMWHHLSNGFPSPRIEMLYNFDDSFMNAAALRFSRFKLVLDGTGFFNGRYRTPGGFRPHNDLNKLLSRSVVADVLKNLYKKTRLVFPRHWRERATLTCGWWQRRNFRPTDSVYLFDIVRDPCELDNLARILPQDNHTGLDFWIGTDPNWADSGVYSTTLYTRRAQHLIRNRQKDKPMFLLMSYQAAHGAGGPDPLQAPKKNVDKFPYIEENARRLYAGGDVAKLGELDGVDMWHHLSTGGHSPRTDMLYNIDPLDPESIVAAVRDSRYKLVLDKSGD